MDTDITLPRSPSSISKTSGTLAVLSVLPIACLFLVPGTVDNYLPVAFCVSVPLAALAVVLGLIGFFGGRPYGYSATGFTLGGVVLLLWGLLILLAVVAAMIALP